MLKSFIEYRGIKNRWEYVHKQNTSFHFNDIEHANAGLKKQRNGGMLSWTLLVNC
jgi:hypothetical protein